jgi:3-oxoacyl-[acyl-carrier protein] reductase
MLTVIRIKEAGGKRMKPLNDKVAVITGSSRGIGAATAVLFAKAGADVVINYHHSEKEALQVLEKVKAAGKKGIVVKADVRKEEDVKKLVDRTVQAFGKVDILINNANIAFAFKPFMEMSWEEFSVKLNDEMRSAFHLCQAVVPHMEKQGRGKIVLISSGLSRTPAEGFIAHGTAKAAIVSFAKYLALELGPKNIRTNVIAPGLVLTDATKDQPKEMHESIRNVTPLRRLAQPEDVAGAVLSLVADWNPFMNGAYLPVNGGNDMD